MKRYDVEYSENNSGGYWWLDEGDYDALQNRGWTKGRVSLGNHTAGASKVFTAPDAGTAEMLAIREWESITGEYAEQVGCTCCGQPHNFYTTEVEDDPAADLRAALETAAENMHEEAILKEVVAYLYEEANLDDPYVKTHVLDLYSYL